MKKILFLSGIIFFLFTFSLRADDMGFRFTPSMTPMLGVVDEEADLQISFDAEITYLIFNQLDFGLGGGWQRQEISNSKEDIFSISEDIQKVFTIQELTANTFPYYGVIRYSFDFFQNSYLVVAFKYGKYYFLSRDRIQKGILPVSTATSPEDNLRFENRLHDGKFFAFNVGYELSRTVISFEYRLSNFKQDLDYINDNTTQTVENHYNRTIHFFGINMSYKIDLF